MEQGTKSSDAIEKVQWGYIIEERRNPFKTNENSFPLFTKGEMIFTLKERRAFKVGPGRTFVVENQEGSGAKCITHQDFLNAIGNRQ